jgi:hypothetical protein
VQSRILIWKSSPQVHSLGAQMCQQVSAGINRCQQVSAGVSRCQQVSTGVSRCQQVSAGVSRCQQVSAGVSRCQQVSAGISRYQQVSAGVIRYRQVSAICSHVILDQDRDPAHVTFLKMPVGKSFFTAGPGPNKIIFDLPHTVFFSTPPRKFEHTRPPRP